MNILYRQLKTGDRLAEENYKQLAGLIYDTDPYIYPALFGCRKNALKLLPELIRGSDPMFDLRNIFAAISDGGIVGLVLWKQGPLAWNPELLYQCLAALKIEPGKYIEDVMDRYFSSYREVRDDTVSIINVCVDSSLRGHGIGRDLLNCFLNETSDICKNYELFVLTDNEPAIMLYREYGFEITEELPGYNSDPEPVTCYRMVKNVTNETITADYLQT